MCATNSVSAADREMHYRALARWMQEHPGGSFCGHADPDHYCGKPLVRSCDYHDHQYELRLREDA